MDIKLIPKDYQQDKSPKGFELLAKKSFLVNFLDKIKQIRLRLPLFSLILVILIVLIFGALIVYRQSLKNRNRTLAGKIIALEAQKDKEMEKEILKFNENLKTVKPMLGAHFYPSKLLNLIKENTLNNVEWLQIETDLKNHSLNLKGKTSSFNMITEQISAFSKDKNIIEINTPGAVLTASGIEFSLNFKFKEELILY